MQCCNCMPQIHISREQLQIHKYKNSQLHKYRQTNAQMHSMDRISCQHKEASSMEWLRAKGLVCAPFQSSSQSRQKKLSFSIHRQLQVMTLELGSTIVCTNVKTNVQSICVCVHCGTVTNILWRCSTVEAGRFGFRAGINKAHSYFTFHTLCIPVFTVDGAITGNCVASLAFNEQTGFF